MIIFQCIFRGTLYQNEYIEENASFRLFARSTILGPSRFHHVDYSVYTLDILYKLYHI